MFDLDIQQDGMLNYVEVMEPKTTKVGTKRYQAQKTFMTRKQQKKANAKNGGSTRPVHQGKI